MGSQAQTVCERDPSARPYRSNYQDMSDSEFKLTSGAEDFVDALYRGLDSVWNKVEIPADKIMTILIIANKNEYLDPKELNRVAYRLFRQSNNKEWSIDEVFEPYKKKYCTKAFHGHMRMRRIGTFARPRCRKTSSPIFSSVS